MLPASSVAASSRRNDRREPLLVAAIAVTPASANAAAASGRDALSTPTIEAQGLTLVGISLANLQDERRMQLAFTFDPRFDALDAALDTVRARFGSASVTRAVLLGRDPRVVMPVLPDEG